MIKVLSANVIECHQNCLIMSILDDFRDLKVAGDDGLIELLAKNCSWEAFVSFLALAPLNGKRILVGSLNCDRSFFLFLSSSAKFSHAPPLREDGKRSELVVSANPSYKVDVMFPHK